MSLLHTLGSLIGKALDKQLFVLLGIPFSFRIVYDPEALVNVLKKHNMSTDDLEKIRFVEGNMDGIIGKYNLQSGDLHIDVHEIAARLPFPDPDLLDRLITQTLAHEIRHSWQRKTYGAFRVKWDQIAMLIGFLVGGCGLCLYALLRVWMSLTLDLGFILIPLCIITLLAGNFLFRTILRLSLHFSYRWCWCERDARAYAEKAVNDPEWGPVIQSQMGLTVPSVE